MKTTNINTAKKYVSAVGFGQGPNLGLKACTGWDTCPSLASPVTLLLYKKKISGISVRRTPDKMTDQAL